MTETMKPKDVPGNLASIVGQELYDTHGNTCPQPGCDGHPGPAACETWARDLLAVALPEHERQVRAKVSAEILAARASLPVATIDDRIFRTAMVLAARVATVGPTRAPQGTGDAHTPEREHGEGPDDSEASQGRSEAQEER